MPLALRQLTTLLSASAEPQSQPELRAYGFLISFLCMCTSYMCVAFCIPRNMSEPFKAPEVISFVSFLKCLFGLKEMATHSNILAWGTPWTEEPAAAAAAKSLQSCPTLCDPIGGSPPGSSVPGILQARTLEWVAISFSNA